MRNDNAIAFSGRKPPKKAGSPGKTRTRRWAKEGAEKRRVTIKQHIMDVLWAMRRPMTPYEIWIEARKRGLKSKPKSIDPVCSRLCDEDHLYGVNKYGVGEGGDPAEKVWLTEKHRGPGGPVLSLYRKNTVEPGTKPKRKKVSLAYAKAANFVDTVEPGQIVQ